MNIFVLDYDPQMCAKYHTDKHVVKMITESAQLLSTACRVSGIDCGYKACYINHPCSKWVRKSLSNWEWLKELSIRLNQEWQIRYNHNVNHKAFETIMSLANPNIPDIGLTQFVLAMPDQYKCHDTVSAYRNYYMGEKRHIATWKTNMPDWWN